MAPLSFFLMVTSDIKSKAHFALFFANMLLGLSLSLYHSILSQHYVTFQQLYYTQLFFSALFFIPFILTKRRYRITFKEVLKLIGIAVLIMFGRQFMLLWGVGYTSPIDSSVLSTLGPILTLVISSILVHEKLHILKILGILCGFTGAALFMFTDRHGLNSSLGNILIFFSVTAAATNTVFSKPLLMKLGTLKVMAWYYVVGMLISTPFFWKDFMAIPVQTLPTQAFIEIGIIVVLGMILPNALLYFGTEKATSVHTALYSYVQPLTAAAVSYARGYFEIDRIGLYATGFIFIGVVLVIISYEKFNFPKVRLS